MRRSEIRRKPAPPCCGHQRGIQARNPIMFFSCRQTGEECPCFEVKSAAFDYRPANLERAHPRFFQRYCDLAKLVEATADQRVKRFLSFHWLRRDHVRLNEMHISLRCISVATGRKQKPSVPILN